MTTRHITFSGRAWGAGAAAVALALLMAGPALAQSALERHPPPAVGTAPASLTITPQNFDETSTKPLGVDLSGIHLIGKDDAVAGQPQRGITGGAEGMTAAAVQRTLAPFLGKPLSLALAGQVQAAIAKAYRDSGYPFVSVTLPPQEITSGVLQVRVFQFRLGHVAVAGGSPVQVAAVRKGLRVTPGATIDGKALEEDLNWLNRSRYRHVEGVFHPGQQTGQSDLVVTLTARKPWYAQAGWSNTGSAATGRNRYFVGFGALLMPLNNAELSYQLTGSTDLWSHPGRIAPTAGNFPQYVDHAARLVLPAGPRAAFEIAPSYVASRQLAGAYTAFENQTFELPIVYRTAISNLAPGDYWGDVYGGIEFKALHRNTTFAGTSVASADARLMQIVLGWSDSFTDKFGRTQIDVSLKGDPGGVLDGNDAATWSQFSNGRVDTVRYAYGQFTIDRVNRLTARSSWVSHLTGMVSGQPLPDSERLSLGGFNAVRGYDLDDVSVDSGAIWRNELRLPTFSLLGHVTGIDDVLSPFLFADAGYGTDVATRTYYSLASIGAGFDYSLSGYLFGSVVAGCVLSDAGVAKRGDWSVQARLSASF